MSLNMMFLPINTDLHKSFCIHTEILILIKMALKTVAKHFIFFLLMLMLTPTRGDGLWGEICCYLWLPCCSKYPKKGIKQ